ncbi:MAG: hypothetical protein QME59_03385 [Candidatus Hydrothermarchaeota archaeon]|nr:hypothetical protein [Candidatus Hydrothermarchaeota archaeon]
MIRGEKSEGVVLAAEDGEIISFVTLDRGVRSGSRVR